MPEEGLQAKSSKRAARTSRGGSKVEQEFKETTATKKGTGEGAIIRKKNAGPVIAKRERTRNSCNEEGNGKKLGAKGSVESKLREERISLKGEQSTKKIAG